MPGTLMRVKFAPMRCRRMMFPTNIWTGRSKQGASPHLCRNHQHGDPPGTHRGQQVTWVQSWVQLDGNFQPKIEVSCARSTKVLTAHNPKVGGSNPPPRKRSGPCEPQQEAPKLDGRVSERDSDKANTPLAPFRVSSCPEQPQRVHRTSTKLTGS